MGNQPNSYNFLYASITEAFRLVPPFAAVLSSFVQIEPGVWPRRRLVRENLDSQQTGKPAQAAFCPFSIGPRAFVAKDMAWVELSLIIARSLFRYDLRLPEDHVSLSPGCCAGLGCLSRKSP
ncbi:unnamed protein product [Penicillium salamii]|uniref:Uncharacterized protein n=1 Tax=Penicillium salamii TaxID=1612424 RepID=A0A9W4J0V0_9EURO|nr:unnamed protein product [Penicillium salamii]CAG8009279.1 unnamed protein product [Penicillium salamii]CAG8022867.1 unnamed protein product [Penicillium salamii]CAG8118843.1 unnamed protein product [Penicillium salamii]CAG8155317.1 unnamed protein product [Penicillium salamii]